MSLGIFNGTQTGKKFFLGSSGIRKIYKGRQLVFPKLNKLNFMKLYNFRSISSRVFLPGYSLAYEIRDMPEDLKDLVTQSPNGKASGRMEGCMTSGGDFIRTSGDALFWDGDLFFFVCDDFSVESDGNPEKVTFLNFRIL